MQDKEQKHKGRRSLLLSLFSFLLLSVPPLSAHQYLFITADKSKNFWQGQDGTDQLVTETVLSSDRGWKTVIYNPHSQIQHKLYLQGRKSTIVTQANPMITLIQDIIRLVLPCPRVLIKGNLQEYRIVEYCFQKATEKLGQHVVFD